jgi:endosialidase-like protein
MHRLRPALCVLLILGFSFSIAAQEDRTTPVVTSAAPVEKIRFAASPTSVQMKIEVLSGRGALVYDSDWKDGNILDWLPQLAPGTYRLVMRSRDLAGQTMENEAALHLSSDGIAVENQPSTSPKATLTGHDGDTGQIITTSGDLAFRFGDFLNRKDAEVMRLTKEGNLGIGTDKPQAPLDVHGVIRTSEGIMFADGTILTTAAGLVAAGGDGGVRRPPGGSASSIVRKDLKPPILPLSPSVTPDAHLTPRPTFAPAYQFVVGDAGVSVGTTNPAYRLDVTGVVNTVTEYDIGGIRFVHSHGTANTFVGPNAGNLTMSGGQNTAVGQIALINNTTGCCNTTEGLGTLHSNTTGGGNTAIGWNALNLNNSVYNTAAGYDALVSTTGGNNTGVGSYALFGNTTGNNNTALGYNAGNNLTTGSRNIDIGNLGVAAESDTIRIGDVQASTFIAGIRGVTVLSDGVNVVIDSTGQLGTVVGVPLSSRRYKYDIESMGDATDGLMQLRPVTFRYLSQGENAPLQYGLIAEEVADVYPDMVARKKDGEVEGVNYQFLAPMLLNDLQKQHQHIDRLESENANLRAQLETLIRRVEQVEGKITER